MRACVWMRFLLLAGAICLMTGAVFAAAPAGATVTVTACGQPETYVSAQKHGPDRPVDPGTAAKIAAKKAGEKPEAQAAPENISASTVGGVSPGTLNTTVPITLCFSVTVSSPDYEYLDRFSVDLPDGWTVNSVNSAGDDGCGYGSTQGVNAGNVVYWQNVDYPCSGCGSWANGTYSFCCSVTLPACTGAPFNFNWTIDGDCYGSAPHSTTGTVGPVSCTEGPPVGQQVLLVSPDSTAEGGKADISSIIAAIQAYPGYLPVVWNNALGTPTAGDMAPYCAVIVGNDFLWDSGNMDSTVIGNSLAGYLDGGGHVIESLYVQSYDAWGMGGTYITGGYSPFTKATTDYWYGDTMNILDPGSPIMTGLGAINDGWGHQDPGLAGGAANPADWTETGYNMVAVNSNVVGINQLLFYSASWTGDVPLMLNNALNYLCPSGPGPGYDMNFRDQYNRSELCLDSTTGDYVYNVLTGAHAGDSFEGTANITPYGATMFLFSTPCPPGSEHCLSGSWNTTRHTAAATLRVYTPVRYSQGLSDANYTDSPPCGTPGK